MQLPALAVLAAMLTASSLAAASQDTDEHRGRVVVTSTTCEILEPVRFAMNDAHLTRAHRKIIQAVARTLLGNPSITRIEIDGFADKHETHADQLGLARATAVMLALEAEGVPAYRMQAGSLGATRPIDAGTTATGQANNRRIEFLIITRDPAP